MEQHLETMPQKSPLPLPSKADGRLEEIGAFPVFRMPKNGAATEQSSPATPPPLPRKRGPVKQLALEAVGILYYLGIYVLLPIAVIGKIISIVSRFLEIV